MAWVVDTSVLLDIHLDDPTFASRSGQCLMRYLLDGLVICPVSYVELAPAFSGDSSLQQAFLQEAGVDWLQPCTDPWKSTTPYMAPAPNRFIKKFLVTWNLNYRAT